jgi:hypothetical protein
MMSSQSMETEQCFQPPLACGPHGPLGTLQMASAHPAATALHRVPTSCERVPGAGPGRHQYPLFYLGLTSSHIGMAGHGPS